MAMSDDPYSMSSNEISWKISWKLHFEYKPSGAILVTILEEDIDRLPELPRAENMLCNENPISKRRTNVGGSQYSARDRKAHASDGRGVEDG
jgi:hypothetical protein